MKSHKDSDKGRKEAIKLRGLVNEYFEIYDLRWERDTYAFYIHPVGLQEGENFEKLRRELKEQHFLPKLSKEKGEYVIYVQKTPKMKFRSKITNLVMFLLTIVSTVWAGAVLWAPFVDKVPQDFPMDTIMILLDWELMAAGFVFFALPLILILGTHELGHYFTARYHKVDASLPFFIPIPPIIGPLGTFGAFISLREPIPNKRALLEIGAAGPIAGFIVALPVTIIGLILTAQNPCYCSNALGSGLVINEPLLFDLFTMAFPIPEGTTLHPVAFAGWVGLFVTALNLLPAGQLDGGHIARALLGDRAKYLSYLTILALVGMAIVTSFITWGFFAILIFLMGPKHPPPLNDLSPLKNVDKVIGVACVAMMVLCFHPIPLQVVIPTETEYSVELTSGCTFHTITTNQTADIDIEILNSGNVVDEYFITYEAAHFNATESVDPESLFSQLESFVVLQDGNGIDNWSIRQSDRNSTVKLDEDRTASLNVHVEPGELQEMGSVLALVVRVQSKNDDSLWTECRHIVRLAPFNMYADEYSGSVLSRNAVPYYITIKNPGNSPLEVTIDSKVIKEDAPTRGWKVEMNTTSMVLSSNSEGMFKVLVEAPLYVYEGNTVVVRITATDMNGDYAAVELTTTVEATYQRYL